METSSEHSDKLRDAQDALWKEKRACFEKEATNRLREQLGSFGKWPNADTVFDLFRDNLVDEVDGNKALRQAIIDEDYTAVGRIVCDDFNKAREEVIDGKIGQMVIEDIINEMWEDSHG